MQGVAFDMETAAAEELHSYGQGFIRLGGWQKIDGDGNPCGDTVISRNVDRLAHTLLEADFVTGHNIINFDILALAVHGYITFDQYEQICRKSFDTLLVERHLNPVAAKGAQPNGYYRLGETAERYGLDGKDLVDFEGKREIVRRVKGDKVADRMKQGKEDAFSVLKILADLYGGFDKIPHEDPDYVRYLMKDVSASAALFRAHRKAVAASGKRDAAYIRREHYTATAMGRTTLEGFRVDVDLTMKRWSEGQARLEAGKRLLHERYGMPLEGKKPHVTNAGKAAFRKAILGTGISERALEANWPTAKDGSLLTGKEVLNGFIPIFEKTKPEAAELCRTILAMNGERSVYGTLLDHLVDGKVHPYIGADQGSGRWSMKNPGLTVLGKRGGKAVERACLLPDTDGEWLLAVDADQVDARVIAAMCQDPEYMKLFEPGMDLHSEVAFRVWPDMGKHGKDCHQTQDWAEIRGCDCGITAKCHCELRDRAKVFGHGFSYGLGAAGMARQHGVDVEVAQGFVRGMTQAFPRLAEWKEEIRVLAGALGFDEIAPAHDSYRILHTWAGRPVRVERNRAYTQATAMVGQGGTRDVMAQALLNMPQNMRRRVRAVIHDEFVFSVPADWSEADSKTLVDSMSFDLNGVQITFGYSPLGKNWAGAYGY